MIRHSHYKCHKHIDKLLSTFDAEKLKMRSLFLLTLLPFTVFSLQYDKNTKTYNDLLVSISPDLPGLMILRLELSGY